MNVFIYIDRSIFFSEVINILQDCEGQSYYPLLKQMSKQRLKEVN